MRYQVKFMPSTLLKTLPQIKGQYREEVDLSKNSWFNVGGKAEVLYKPSDTVDLSCFLKNVSKEIPITILGACSNVIIRDKAIDGVVIKLGRGFTDINVSGTNVEIGCAALDHNVALFLSEHSLSGLEFLIGIPGVIGGAIAMNAGCYGQELSDHLVSVEAVDIESGKISYLNKDQLGLSYRYNKVANKYIFTKASFALQNRDKQEVQERMNSISSQREETQPIKFKTGGSTFKNPYDHRLKAWQLIDKAGLRGYKLGDAQISEKHCNFMLNLGSATAKNLEQLGELVRDRVYRDSGIMLEWEIKRIGR